MGPGAGFYNLCLLYTSTLKLKEFIKLYGKNHVFLICPVKNMESPPPRRSKVSTPLRNTSQLPHYATGENHTRPLRPVPVPFPRLPVHLLFSQRSYILVLLSLIHIWVSGQNTSMCGHVCRAGIFLAAGAVTKCITRGAQISGFGPNKGRQAEAHYLSNLTYAVAQFHDYRPINIAVYL